MIYVIDTSSLIVTENYYLSRFRKFWAGFNSLCDAGRITSVKESYRELDYQVTKPHLRDWMQAYKGIFLAPSAEESAFVAQIFAIKHFQNLIRPSKTLGANPSADPFIIASAKIREACVVTEELKKDGAAKIPNICEYFEIEWTNFEGVMEREKWEF
jgi:hypothetical protein